MSFPSTIAHYRITAKLGEGGMGAVYRATDTKLGREVAVKVIPDVFAQDPDRMARFTREAQVLASLNHPNIAAIYGVEDRALVMELVEGETLAERIAHGPIPLEEALPIARQIAEALEVAHEKGIIHRDLKPANVKINAEGGVKVLDFGLAKVSDPTSPRTSDPAASPTLTIQSTGLGIILGTAAYMPPEQARGLVVDKRADVWAFGCLLYEMLSGKRMFEGESTTDVLAAVVRADPEWNKLPASTPAPILRLLKRCLEKDRKRRLPDIGVAKFEIDDALAAPVTPLLPVAPPANPRSILTWIGLAAAAAILAAGGAYWYAGRAQQHDVWSGVMLGGPAKSMQPRLSPDGQMLLFLAFVDQLPQVAVMKPNGGSWTALTTDREHGYVVSAAWSADGSKIYFDRLWGHPLGIYTVPPLGGEARLLLEDAYAPEPLPDGSIVVVKMTDHGDTQLFRFWPDSGKLDPLPAYMSLNDVAPILRAFPDGRDVIYSGTGEKDRTKTARMMVLNLASKQVRELSPGLPGIAQSSWAPLDVAPDGDSVYLASQLGDTSSLFEVPRRPGRKPRALMSFPSGARPTAMDATPDGSIYLDLYQPQALILRFDATGGSPEQFEMGSNGGSNVIASGGNGLLNLTAWGKRRLCEQHLGSEPRTLVETTEDTATPATVFGGNVAFVIGSGDQRRIAVASLRDGRVLRRFSMRTDMGLVASPDGNTLYYSFDGAIWAQPVAGGDPKRITDGIDVTIDAQGQFLYLKRATKGALGIFRVPIGGGEAEEFPVPADFHIADIPLSPIAADARGRLLVTVATNHGFYYVPAILDSAAKSFKLVPVTVDGDCFGPGWAPDGKIVALGQHYLFSLWRYRRQ